jgi:hypothetical protein
MRDFAIWLCLYVRVPGVLLALLMIAFGWLGEFPFSFRPEAEIFISRRSLYLFVWFLLPYFLFRRTAVWIVLVSCLVAASAILVKSGFSVYAFYSKSAPTPAREMAVFQIIAAIVTCAAQPLAVCAGRFLLRGVTSKPVT